MTSAANNQGYGDPRWGPNPNPNAAGGGGPWGNGHGGQGPWGFMPPWMPPFAAKPLLIVAMILGFMFWWPVGLVLLGVMIWHKRMWCGYRRHGGWQNGGQPGGAPWTGWKNWSGGGGGHGSSGNRAFDEYRTETLRRLEDEQKEFGEFLDRLRFAKDKSEFDQFMNERRNRPAEAPPQPPTG